MPDPDQPATIPDPPEPEPAPVPEPDPPPASNTERVHGWFNTGLSDLLVEILDRLDGLESGQADAG
jgi:hypothetical protein